MWWPEEVLEVGCFTPVQLHDCYCLVEGHVWVAYVVEELLLERMVVLVEWPIAVGGV